MSELSITEIKKVSLEDLSFLHQICVENGIKYYLAYGTLLGCIRHNGFIPWDDDVDVWMYRDDYGRLIEVFKNNNFGINNFRLCIKESTKNYCYSIGRLSDQRYKYISREDTNYPDMGTFIDIYPLDYVRDEESFKKLYKKINNINRIYSIYTGSRSNSRIKNFFRTLLHYLSTIVHNDIFPQETEKKILNLIDIESSNSEKKYVAVPSWFTTGQKIYLDKWFNEPVLHGFEGKEFYIPTNYDDILKCIYGDYMTPPPMEQRVQYHQYSIIEREKFESSVL